MVRYYVYESATLWDKKEKKAKIKALRIENLITKNDQKEKAKPGGNKEGHH